MANGLTAITSGLSDEARADLVADLRGLGIDARRVYFEKSAEGPEAAFIQLVGDLLQWTTLLRAAAAYFLLKFGGRFAGEFAGQLGKRAADDLWNQGTEVLRKIVFALRRAQSGAEKAPVIVPVLELPDLSLKASLAIDTQDEIEIAGKLAHFVKNLDGIEAAVREEGGGQRGVLGQDLRLHLQDDGSFLLEWRDRQGRLTNRRIPPGQ